MSDKAMPWIFALLVIMWAVVLISGHYERRKYDWYKQGALDLRSGKIALRHVWKQGWHWSIVTNRGRK